MNRSLVRQIVDLLDEMGETRNDLGSEIRLFRHKAELFADMAEAALAEGDAPMAADCAAVAMRNTTEAERLEALL